jgi:hypothetical protein
MNIHFFNYVAGDKYIALQEKQHALMQGFGFINMIKFRDSDLKLTAFATKNKNILNEPRWAGCCLWKPYYMLKVLSELDWGEVAFYADVEDVLPEDICQIVEESVKDHGHFMMLHAQAYNFQFTKRNVFVDLRCDCEECWYHPMIEAGVIAFQKNSYNMKLISEWLMHCEKENLILPTPPENITNITGFIDYRADQSILSVMAWREKLKTEAIQYYHTRIKCNFLTLEDKQ